jgi:hypothetical protein
MDFENESTWLLHRVLRLRTILRYVKDPRAESGPTRTDCGSRATPRTVGGDATNESAQRTKRRLLKWVLSRFAFHRLLRSLMRQHQISSGMSIMLDLPTSIPRVNQNTVRSSAPNTQKRRKTRSAAICVDVGDLLHSPRASSANMVHETHCAAP